ncbi:UNVERIFIED_CONTAM: hypothetical protein RMT77_004583 [Armadillidium vulgare]
MSLIDGRLARTMEELYEFDFEISHIVGKNNIIADALSRSPCSSVPESDEKCTNLSGYIPEGFQLVEVSGGGDAIFKCFSLYLYDCDTSHQELRIQTVDELFKNINKYKLANRQIRKQLRLMKLDGQVPIPEIIEAFSQLYKTKVVIYYNDKNTLIYGSKFTDKVCTMKCLAGIHYNFLKPIEIMNNRIEPDVVIQINAIQPLIDDASPPLDSNINVTEILTDQKTDKVIVSLIKSLKDKIL